MRGCGRGTVVGLVAVGLGGLVGCGANPNYQMSPKAAPEEPSPATVEEAQSQLDRAEVRLRQISGRQPPTGTSPPSLSGGLVSPPPAPPPAPAATSPVTGVSPVKPGTDEHNQATDGSHERSDAESCHDACRALSSMRRAADTVCRLAGEGDERCVSARRRVQEGAGQMGVCRCGG